MSEYKDDNEDEDLDYDDLDDYDDLIEWENVMKYYQRKGVDWKSDEGELLVFERKTGDSFTFKRLKYRKGAIKNIDDSLFTPMHTCINNIDEELEEVFLEKNGGY